MSDREHRAEEIFHQALAFEGKARAEFLDGACGGDTGLLEEVESLLRHHDEAGSFLKRPVAGMLDARTEHLEPVHAPSDQIGPYRLLQVLGEGGMGEVWLAEQREPIRRTVALKIIKRGLDTKEIVARFEAERQALALMNHPCVTRVFDAGSTPRGMPYFVMEHVEGIPITEYCDRRRLTTRERLKLFARICEGVQHAHQKAIIHRDLKPTNVLVSEHDGVATPKIIDFGVAKATAQKLTEKTMFTELGVMIGTPEYMSPEQADLTGEDVDTRTDVYALGVMLYELLVGALPFSAKELREAGFDAIRRKIREEEPLRPSTKFSSLGDEASTSAKARRVEPSALQRELQGDLDWITMKALEKDRARRYGSPAELAADLRRHLANEPVEAGPPSTVYRLRKFVRRHRTGVVVAALLMVAVLVGVAGLGIGLQRAVEAEQRALAAEADALQEAAISQRVTEFLTEMFKVSNPGDAESRDVTAREILDAGAERIREGLSDTPVVRASLMDTMGEVYVNLGEYEAAESLLREALDVRQREFGPEALEVAQSANKMAVFLAKSGRLADARPMFERALAIREKQLGRDHPDVAQSLSNLAIVVRRLGDHEAAIPLAERSLEIRQRQTGPESPEVGQSLMGLAAIHFETGGFEEAEELYSRALAIYEAAHGPVHADVGMALVNLGNAQTQLGTLADARISFERALDIWAETLDPDHPLIGFALNNVADLLVKMDELEAGRDKYEQALQFRTRTLGPSHPDVAYPMTGLASTEHKLGNLERSREMFERARALRAESLGADHPEMLVILDEYADVLDELNEASAAESIREQAVRIRAGVVED